MAQALDLHSRHQVLTDGLIAVGQGFDRRGWVPASSGNFSARIDQQQVLMTASGRHKGELKPEDLLVMDVQGQVLGSGTASYEAGLHLQLYHREPGIGAVLHTHSLAATLLSRQVGPSIDLRAYELQKLFDGYADPTRSLAVPVFPNLQDIELLATGIESHMQAQGTGHAYLIEGHGLYVWGADIQQARLRVEAMEFMLACEWQALHTGARISDE